MKEDNGVSTSSTGPAPQGAEPQASQAKPLVPDADELDRLKRQRDEAAVQIRAFEDAERARASSELIGKCYKYSNSYGSGDRWWLYMRITGVGDHWPMGVKFEHTSSDECRISRESFIVVNDGYIEITTAEFIAALDAFLADAAAIATDTRRAEKQHDH